MSVGFYNVVFEYENTKGGLCGSRFTISYLDKSMYLDNPRKDENVKVVSEGITDQEAEKLLYLVPPLCHYMAAVEQAFYQEPAYIPQQLEKTLYGAIIAVDAGRKYLWDHLLFGTNQIDDTLLAFFQSLTIPNTAKAVIMSTIITMYDFDLNDLTPLARGETFIKVMKNQCQKTLNFFPKG